MGSSINGRMFGGLPSLVGDLLLGDTNLDMLEKTVAEGSEVNDSGASEGVRFRILGGREQYANIEDPKTAPNILNHRKLLMPYSPRPAVLNTIFQEVERNVLGLSSGSP